MSGEEKLKGMKTMRPIAEMAQREVWGIQNELTQLRWAIVKAQTDVAHICMLAPGESQTALEHEVMGFMRDAQAHFVELKKLLVGVA